MDLTLESCPCCSTFDVTRDLDNKSVIASIEIALELGDSYYIDWNSDMFILFVNLYNTVLFDKDHVNVFELSKKIIMNYVLFRQCGKIDKNMIWFCCGPNVRLDIDYNYLKECILQNKPIKLDDPRKFSRYYDIVNFSYKHPVVYKILLGTSSWLIGTIIGIFFVILLGKPLMIYFALVPDYT
jgi:hypothetical protein